MADGTRGTELLNELLGGRSSEEVVGADGFPDELTMRPKERVREGELMHRPGYAKHAPEGRELGNGRTRSA